MNVYKNEKFFTLSEVLMTLAVIGVVAAIVIPTAVNNINEAELRASWKKSYADLSNAVRQMVQDEGGSLKGLLTTSNVNNRLKRYLNVSTDCGAGAGCWHAANEWRGLNGNPLSNTGSTMLLANGNLLMTMIDDTNCNSNYGSINNKYMCGWIRVDVNGYKGPNIQGRDIFLTWIQEDSLRPAGTPNDSQVSICQLTSTGGGCAAKYLKE